ncbi:hypothetical protein Taro_006138 [Colocasia esculenta]|uniref:Uncharacterized GPI-anchored protein At5g19230-like domain-containing protein n=1 Tax=Colocasia esculenta TaxID=4460 RepID=A0A843TUF5_COLES|nr:hypothetical protein [Colocasia esculenta]
MAGSGVRSSPTTSAFLLIAAVSLFYSARSQDTSSQLLQGINSYRTFLNLSTLTENQNAACLADQVAQQFKDQGCTNTTGANTVPGTNEQFPNFPDLLAHCHLDPLVTQDGQILPACVPGLTPSLVLANFTKSQYNQFLNDTSYTGAGIASEGNWIVLVLSTNTSQGNFATVEGGSAILEASVRYSLLSLFLALWF